MLEDSQSKLESCEKPTSSKAERDKQAAFLNVRNIYTSEDKTIASWRIEKVEQETYPDGYHLVKLNIWAFRPDETNHGYISTLFQSRCQT